MTRRAQTEALIDKAIAEHDILALLTMADGPPCACRGSTDGEPLCRCKMNSRQVRAKVSRAALQRGQILRLKATP